MNNTFRQTACIMYIFCFLSRSEKCIQFYYFHRFRNKRRKKSTRSLILHNDMYEYNLPILYRASNIDMLQKNVYIQTVVSTH